MKIFIDTGVFIAYFIKEDTYNEKVSTQWHSYRDTRSIFFTSKYILSELYTRILYNFGPYAVKQIVPLMDESIHHGEVRILDVDDVIFEKTQTEFLRFSEHALSFTDASSYVLCKEFALDEVFTLDSDFKKIGVKTSF
jgi:predicted nucleic acid-binding protein